MKRLPMRKIREALRLQAAGHSRRQIATSLGVGRTTAGEYLQRAERADLSWPLPADLDDATLEQCLFPAAQTGPGPVRFVPDWSAVHRELRRAGVTLALLWEEYRAVHVQGYGYSRFCELYRRWAGRLSPTMRQVHIAGEKIFVDYAGQTIEIMDGLTGEVHAAQLFVAVLGASSYTYAEATWTQSLPDWTGSHCRAFSFFGGVTAQVVSDNLKSGITVVPEARFAATPAFTSRRSIALTPILHGTTTRQSFQHGPTNRAIKPKSKSACRSPNAGYCQRSGTGNYSHWPNSTRPFVNFSTSSTIAYRGILEPAVVSCSSSLTARP